MSEQTATRRSGPPKEKKLRAQPALIGRTTTILTRPIQKKTWRHVDAAGVPLGRLASEVAIVLMGKHRPEFSPQVDCSDFVVITNAEKVALTGRKAEQRLKQRYSKYPGGLKSETYGQVRDRKPELLISDAVRRMLPKNRISRMLLKNMMVYRGTEHPHSAQKMVPLPVG